MIIITPAIQTANGIAPATFFQAGASAATRPRSAHRPPLARVHHNRAGQGVASPHLEKALGGFTLMGAIKRTESQFAQKKAGISTPDVLMSQLV